MRVLAKGRTHGECLLDVTKKEGSGWKKITDVKFDDSYIGGRYVCVMEKPDIDKKKSKFNNYMGGM